VSTRRAGGDLTVCENRQRPWRSYEADERPKRHSRRGRSQHSRAGILFRPSSRLAGSVGLRCWRDALRHGTHKKCSHRLPPSWRQETDRSVSNLSTGSRARIVSVERATSVDVWLPLGSSTASVERCGARITQVLTHASVSHTSGKRMQVPAHKPTTRIKGLRFTPSGRQGRLYVAGDDPTACSREDRSGSRTRPSTKRYVRTCIHLVGSLTRPSGAWALRLILDLRNTGIF